MARKEAEEESEAEARAERRTRGGGEGGAGLGGLGGAVRHFHLGEARAHMKVKQTWHGKPAPY